MTNTPHDAHDAIAERGGPLGGVRVLDLTSDQGRFGAKLLAEFGADVVRLVEGEAGPTLDRDDERHGLLTWWYDANCRSLPLDLTDRTQADLFRRLVPLTDILIDDAKPGTLDELGAGAADLAELNPGLVHVSLSPYGAEGPRAGWKSSDLVAQAQAGHLSVSGDVDAPVTLWGRQSAVVGGLYTAVSALAALNDARRSGRGTWIDLSLHEALISCSEHLLMYWWYPEALAPLGAPIAGRQRSLHWIRAFEVVPCKRGACMVSPAAGGLVGLIAWLKERGHGEDIPAEPEAEEVLTLVPALMTALRAAALETDATELFEAGQSLHTPFGESYSIPQVAACPQHEHREFFRSVDGRDDRRLPGPLARFSRTPAPSPTSPAAPIEADELMARWTPRANRARPSTPPTQPDGGGGTGGTTGVHGPRPLDGIRVLDFTHVLAGPFATRLFADLGADVIRLQTEERSGGASANEFPYNVMWARGKRSVQLAMKHDRALEVLRTLVEQADVVVDNFSAGVMASWGAGPEQLARWNSRVITMSMSGCGVDGPWSEFVTYAPTVHALSGFTALTGPPGETDCGPGIAYNDHISGLVGATALLSALSLRAEHGNGQHIDISQLEVGTHLVGPALIDYFATGREAVSNGNVDPFANLLVNDAFPTGDDEWLAVTVEDDEAWARVSTDLGLAPDPAEAAAATAAWASTGTAADMVERLQRLGVAAGVVATAAHLMDDPQLAARRWLRTVDSDMVGSQTTERYPARLLRDGATVEVALPTSPSPYLGQHNFEVYRELLGWDEIAVAEALGDELLL